MLEHPEDPRYREIVLEPINVCAQYKPKFGQGGRKGLSLETFQSLYQADAFYNWFGLDNPLMYAAHKAAGGMTSVYRQIGIGCERLFRQVLIDSLGLSDEDATWWYERETPSGRRQKLYLDGRIPLQSVENSDARDRVRDWIHRAAGDIGVQKPIADSLTGVVFEVRQGYKSKDSKRQNADIANAASAYINTYLPCAVILSNQIDGDIQNRYRGERWAMVTGIVGTDNDLRSTYAFTRQVLGYDLAAFFERNSGQLRAELDRVLQSLLKAG
ncbi:MAG: hypothetical protein OXI54_08785 [Chloroflexota bacterium]|nr:hypothetical protein [Chloroflexota bacterium]MDE2684232.1 hypothetical protein [Chloroflexota bacterium]